MFVLRTSAATATLLLALAGNGPCPGAAGPVLGKAPAGATAIFPDGVVHDFGKVQRGTQARYAFRVVNTSAGPLRVGPVRHG